MGIEIGRRIGKRVRSRRAAERDRRLSAKVDGWAARHRLLTTLAVAVLAALAAWYVAARRDGASPGEFALFAAILVPIGIVSTWTALTRIRRRGTAKEPTADR